MTDRNPGSSKRNHLLTEKDFSGGAVQRVVLKETLQHPATIIPLGVAGGFTGLMILGLMAVNPVTLIVPLVASLVGGGAWVYNYGVQGKELARKYIQGLRDQLEQARQEEIIHLRQDCQRAGFDEGYKEGGELETAYLKIRTYLENKAQAGQALDAVRYQALAKDIYREGLKLLRVALDAHKALQTIDVKALKRDRENYARQLKRAEPNSSETKSLDARIKNHDDRIATYERHSDVIYQLLTQLEELEGALENSYLELVDLTQGRGLTTPAESVNRLESAVQAARKVEARLRGEETRDEDQMYLEAGRKKS